MSFVAASEYIFTFGFAENIDQPTNRPPTTNQ